MSAWQSGQWGWVMTSMLKGHIWTLVLLFVCCVTLGKLLNLFEDQLFQAVSPTSWVYCEEHDRYPVNVLSFSFHKSLIYLPWTQMRWKEGWTEIFICSHSPSSLFTPAAPLLFPMPLARLFFNFSRHSQTQHLLQALAEMSRPIKSILWETVTHTLILPTTHPWSLSSLFFFIPLTIF